MNDRSIVFQECKPELEALLSRFDWFLSFSEKVKKTIIEGQGV